MLQIPENVRQVITQLVPASVVNEITSYVFYDNHPRDDKEIDIIICTKMGEVREYFNRNMLSSVNLHRITETSEIKIMRNSKCELFYFVAVGDQITILSRKDALKVHQELTGVFKYELSDAGCTGQAILKVETEYSDGPLVSDDNFQNFKNLGFTVECDQPQLNLQLPIIKHLMQKLTESRHTAACINQSYTKFLDIRHSIVYALYKEIHPNLDDSIFKDSPNMIAGALKINLQKLWIKSCNKKIVIAFNVCHSNSECLKDVQILLHGTMRPTLQYTTKVFEKKSVAPFWKEMKQKLKPNTEYALVVVIPMKEMKDNVLNKVEFNSVMVFKKAALEYSLPIEAVNLKPQDTMGEQFDVLSMDTIDNNILLAILASTEKTDLLLRHAIQESFLNDLPEALTMDIFCNYLQMERILNDENIVIFNKSPYHVLNGVMIVLNKDGKNYLAVTVYSRTPSQVLALIHIIHDIVPFQIITTTPTYKITVKNNSLLLSDMNGVNDIKLDYNFEEYATSVLNRASMILDYLDNSMISMSESKNAAVRNKIGIEIDLFPQGEVPYKEFKENMRVEASKGVKSVKRLSVPNVSSEDITVLSD